MMTKRVISLAVMGVILVLGSVSTSRTFQPLWHFQIDDMTHLAMSANGEYIITACEKGPLCNEGQYYVFDQYGNTVNYGCIESEITVVDIADNGAFFIGTRTGYYFSPSSWRTFQEVDMGNIFKSVSMSENGQVAIAGTDKEILIFDYYGLKDREYVEQPINFTAISDGIAASAKRGSLPYDQSSSSSSSKGMLLLDGSMYSYEILYLTMEKIEDYSKNKSLNIMPLIRP